MKNMRRRDPRQRTEPRIGDLPDTDGMPRRSADRASTRHGGFRRAVLGALSIVVVLGLPFAAYVLSGVEGGWLRNDDGLLHSRLAVLFGLWLAAGAQCIGAALLLFSTPLMALASLAIPGFFLVALRRVGAYGAVVGAWLAGLASMAWGSITIELAGR